MEALGWSMSDIDRDASRVAWGRASIDRSSLIPERPPRILYGVWRN